MLEGWRHNNQRIKKACWDCVMASPEGRASLTTSPYSYSSKPWGCAQVLKPQFMGVYYTLHLVFAFSGYLHHWNERKQDFQWSHHLHCSKLIANHLWNCVHWGASPSTSHAQSSIQPKQEGICPHPPFYVLLRLNSCGNDSKKKKKKRPAASHTYFAKRSYFVHSHNTGLLLRGKWILLILKLCVWLVGPPLSGKKAEWKLWLRITQVMLNHFCQRPLFFMRTVFPSKLDTNHWELLLKSFSVYRTPCNWTFTLSLVSIPTCPHLSEAAQLWDPPRNSAWTLPAICIIWHSGQKLESKQNLSLNQSFANFCL